MFVRFYYLKSPNLPSAYPHPTQYLFGGVLNKIIRTPFMKTYILNCFLESDLIVSPPSQLNPIALS